MKADSPVFTRFGLFFLATLLFFMPITATDAQLIPGVMAVAWSPDGTQIATGSTDNQIYLWAADGQLLKTLTGHSDIVNSLAWNPLDSNQLASGSSDHTVKIWNTTTEQAVKTLRHDDIVRWISWSPDGKELASIVYFEENILRIWDTSTWEIKFIPPAGNIARVIWSPDEKLLAIPAFTGHIRLVTRRSDYATTLRILERHTNMVSISWNPNGGQLASGSADGSILLWDIASGQSFPVMESSQVDTWDIAFNPDGTLLAAGGTDGIIHVWDTTTYEEVQSFPIGGTIPSLAWSPDGTKIVCGSIGPDQQPDVLHLISVNQMAD